MTSLEARCPQHAARRIIVGLGNPGRPYRGTRHNVGFMVADQLAAQHGAAFRPRGLLRLAVLALPGLTLSVVKPATYMNRSGEGLAPWFARQGVALRDMLVVQDDLDLPVGRLRLKRSGGPGGHRGVENLIERLGGESFPRLKVGVGRPPPGFDPTDYVLRRPDAHERELLAGAVREACAAGLVWAREGIQAAMNLYNRPPRPDPETAGCGEQRA